VKKNSKIIFFIALLVFGFIFRYILSSRIDGTLWGDEAVYQNHANEFISGKLVADCCAKTVGYSAFLAGITLIFGRDNIMAVRVIQIILDLLSGLILYSFTSKLFSPKTALMIFLIYITNPISGSLVGLRLSEIVTILIITMIAFVLAQPAFKTKRLLWIAVGFLLGLLVFVRLQFNLFVLSVIPLLGILYFRKQLKIWFVLFATIGLLAGSSYTLIANYESFHVLSLSAPFTASWASLNAHFYDIYRWPELNGQPPPWTYNQPYADIFADYATTDYTSWPALEQKNKSIVFGKLPSDWPAFAENSVRNIIWMWDKYHLSESYDRYYPADVIPVRIYNILLLALSFAGISVYVKRNGKPGLTQPLIGFTVYLFLFITFVFSLMDNESRHTLPFYPLAILWAGYGLNCLFGKTKKPNTSLP
jgi:4-amino-4-deoxy-L-arabinose transferase-like glycosyltransferase